MKPDDGECPARDARNLAFRALADWGWPVTQLLNGNRLNCLIQPCAVPAFVTGHILPLSPGSPFAGRRP